MLTPKLASDRRGMILVIAIPMGAVLVGMLWYLATVGDAVLYRERLQDAADATAFENAVLHARGMNAIAMMNMLMAMLLSVVVALRAAEIVLAAGLVFFGVTAPALEAVVSMDLRVSPRIGKAIGLMNKLEKGIAAATPVMSAVLSSGGNTSFYRQHEAASATLSFSYALFPSELDDRSRVNPRDRSQLLLGGGGEGGERMGATLTGSGASRAMPSLPVEDGSYDDLCKEAMTFGLRQIIGIGNRMGVPSSIMSPLDKFLGVFGDLLVGSHVTSVFCLTGPGAVEAAMASACDDSDLPDDAPADDDKNATATSGKHGSDSRRTKESARAEVDECGRQAKRTGSGGSHDGVEKPAQMWGRAQNGNVIMQTWALATNGAPRYQDSDERGMAMASPQNRPDLQVNRMASAQAEYYFACHGRWSSCREDATWALGWTARMRRFWWPLQSLQTASNSIGAFEEAFGAIEGFLDRGLSDVGAGTDAAQLGEDADAVLRGRDVIDSLRGPKDKWVH